MFEVISLEFLKNVCPNPIVALIKVKIHKILQLSVVIEAIFNRHFKELQEKFSNNF